MTIRADADGFLYRTASKSEAKRIEYQQKPPYYTASYLKELIIKIADELAEEGQLTKDIRRKLDTVAEHLREQG